MSHDEVTKRPSRRAQRAALGWVLALGATGMAGCMLSSEPSGDVPGIDASIPTIDGGAPDGPHISASDGAIDAPADRGVDATPDTSAPDTSVPDAGVDAADADVPDAIDAADAAEPIDAADAALPPTGCADGTREGFLSVAAYPAIAACAGGWSIPGVTGTPAPACARQGGNDGPNPTGTGCGAADLCAVGWHVCATSAEVAASSADGCAPATVDGGAPQFFATGQSGPGTAMCGAGSNDVFGCGSLGEAPNADCTPLDRFSDNLCGVLGAPWSCGTDGLTEADHVVKTDSSAGGVMCCQDP